LQREDAISPRLQSRLDALSTLPGFSSFKCLPTRHRTSFHTDHVLVSLIRSKVGHALGLFNPRVPDHDIVQSLPSNREQRLVILSRGDDNGNGWVETLVNTISFLGDGESGGGFGMGGGVEGLVDVGLGFEVLNADIGDVLFV
jgi:hypothetical protein